MNILSKTVIIIGGIVLLAFFLRFYRLGNNPPSLTWDEVAWGYNAYSLGIDGRDEYGRFLPLDYLESFGDFKPPLYAYLDVIPVKFFGLNEFATRFPSAFFGVLTVLITYFLVKRIFYKSKFENYYALACAGILAISPWHIMLSRAAFEANIATFFLVCGVWLFLYGIQERKWYLILSIVSFILSIYTFNTARIVAPLLVLTLGIGFRKRLFEFKKQVLIAVIFGTILLLPTLSFFLSPQANLRFREVNIFSDAKVIEIANQEIANDGNALWSKMLHNRRFAYAVEYLRHYLDNLNPSFLFIRGDGNPKFSTQTVGEMYLWDLAFFIIGIFILFRKKEGNWWLVPVWLILGIVPAATARETPHALRIEASLPTFQILAAYGLCQYVSSIKMRKALLFIIFSFLVFNFIYYYHDYYSHYARQYSGEWQYGYKESIDYARSVENNYDQIIVTQDLGRPYIYYLFYTKTDPRNFRLAQKVSRETLGFVHVEGFNKYVFPKNVEFYPNKNYLYINLPQKVPSNGNVLKTFYLLNGEPALVAYE